MTKRTADLETKLEKVAEIAEMAIKEWESWARSWARASYYDEERAKIDAVRLALRALAKGQLE